MTPVAFISALWRKRFGWDDDSLASTHPTLTPEALRAAYREARDAQIEYRSTHAVKEPAC